MNDDIDTAAQDDPEWVVWSSPERISAVIDKLFTETLPRVPPDWKTQTGSAYPIGPMPQGLDRYSDELTLHWLDDAFDYFFPEEDVILEPKNRDLVDQWVCYIGEYFVRHCGGRWINDPEVSVLHGFGPTIRFDWIDETDYPMNLLLDAADQPQRFRVVTAAWYSRAVDYAKAHGLEHEGIDLLREHGLA
ncbi:hypothetical protein [Nocardia carnea]|uniref:hypothetical protein n=1 Tax=Nocardia carnea TaxID=37328 RepID=UPI002454792B|nr:hypothetical protein [Nocardia carnea]